jgi:glycosyltransferase involved in cell wall biosynthesis
MDNQKMGIKVVVVVTTYNQQTYIAKCLESILAQNILFDTEIHVYDDFSTDKTVSEIEKVISNNKNLKIKTIYSQKNQRVFGWGFFYDLLQSLECDYIAILEGDDYWTDSNKLIKQITFLEENPDFALVSSSFDIVDGFDKVFSEYTTTNREITFEDLKIWNPIGTLATVFRRNKLPKIDINLYNQLEIGDYPLWALILESGKGYLMEDKLAAYRIHSQNSFALQSSNLQYLHQAKAQLFVLKHSNFPEKWIQYIYENLVLHDTAKVNADFALANLKKYTNHLLSSDLTGIIFPDYAGKNRVKSSFYLLKLSILLLLSTIKNFLIRQTRGILNNE